MSSCKGLTPFAKFAPRQGRLRSDSPPRRSGPHTPGPGIRGPTPMRHSGRGEGSASTQARRMTVAQRAPSQARKQGRETGRPSPAERGRGPVAAAKFRTPAAVAAAVASPSPVGSLQEMISASSSRFRGRDRLRSSCRHREGVGSVIERLAAAVMGGELRGTHRYAARGAGPDGPQSPNKYYITNTI